MAGMAAPATLVGLWLWGYIDRIILGRAATKYKAAPLPTGTPKFTNSDVSIVTCAVTPEPSFLYCLESWLRNNPLEVLIVTVPPFYDILAETIKSASFDTAKVQLLVAPIEHANIRCQLSHGIEHAEGKLIIGVDGHIHWGPSFIQHMIPCFEDDTIGAAGPDIKIRIEPSRQDPNVITPWEAASLRQFSNGRAAKKDIYAATKFRLGISGCAIAFRASIFQTPEFKHAFLNDIWHSPFGRRTRLNSGEDQFMSRWVASHGYVCATQDIPETLVTRVPKRNFKPWMLQLLRWERSTMQSYFRMMWETPQIWRSWLIARKIMERSVLCMPLFVIHIWAWVASLKAYPVFTLALMGYYVMRTVKSLRGYFKENPFVPLQYWWVVLFVDYVHYLIFPYVIWTLSVDEWFLKERTTQPVLPEMVTSKTEPQHSCGSTDSE